MYLDRVHAKIKTINLVSDIVIAFIFVFTVICVLLGMLQVRIMWLIGRGETYGIQRV